MVGATDCAQGVLLAGRRPGARAARDDRASPAVPGAGLGIRIIGEVTAQRLATLRATDAMGSEEQALR
ncbi:MAG: hypothetical protein ACRDT0_00915 [Pseudonocardiaceae bacterium]